MSAEPKSFVIDIKKLTDEQLMTLEKLVELERVRRINAKLKVKS